MNKFIILTLVMTLSACHLFKPKTITKFEVVTIPKSLIQPCEVPEPPNPILFKKMEPINREIVLTEMVLKSLGSLEECNSRMRSLNEFNDKLIKLKGKPHDTDPKHTKEVK